MAIAFDAATDGGNNGGSTSSLTFSHTCTGSDRILFVGFAGVSGGFGDDISGVTYNSVAMTLVDKKTDSGPDRNTYIYMLVNPASGSNNVVISSTTTQYILGGAVSYTGAKQSSQPDATATNEASSSSETSLTTSLTTIADNCWAMLLEEDYNGNNPPSAGTGTTRRVYDAAFGTWGLFDGNGAVTPAGSTSLETTRSSAPFGNIAHVMASFSPAAASSSAALTGTATETIDESDVVTGGKTIIITLTGDTFVAAGTGPIGSTADTQAIIDGISAATSPSGGWNDEWRDKEVTSSVVRTSDTVCTITMSSQATLSGSYDISSQETITVTVPGAALTGASPIVASPTFTVDAVGGLSIPIAMYHYKRLMGVN